MAVVDSKQTAQNVKVLFLLRGLEFAQDLEVSCYYSVAQSARKDVGD